MKKRTTLATFILTFYFSLSMASHPANEHYARAETLFAERKVDAALEQIKQAIALDPENIKALVFYGELLMNANREQQAYPVLQKAAARYPQDRALRLKLANNLLWVANNRYSRHSYWLHPRL